MQNLLWKAHSPGTSSDDSSSMSRGHDRREKIVRKILWRHIHAEQRAARDTGFVHARYLRPGCYRARIAKSKDELRESIPASWHSAKTRQMRMTQCALIGM